MADTIVNVTSQFTSSLSAPSHHHRTVRSKPLCPLRAAATVPRRSRPVARRPSGLWSVGSGLSWSVVRRLCLGRSAPASCLRGGPAGSREHWRGRAAARPAPLPLPRHWLRRSAVPAGSRVLRPPGVSKRKVTGPRGFKPWIALDEYLRLGSYNFYSG